MRPAATLDPRDFQPQQNKPAVTPAAPPNTSAAQPAEPEKTQNTAAESATVAQGSKTPAPSLLANSPIRLPLSVIPAPGLPAPFVFPLEIPADIPAEPGTAAAAAPTAATELQGPFILQQSGRKSRSFRTL
ncbi:MAG: hypothetical protein ACKPJJ_23805, partial [Planctomycetaceae bacterium]